MLVGKCPKPSERKGKERIHERTQKNGANQIQSDGSGTGFNTGKNEGKEEGRKEGTQLEKYNIAKNLLRLNVDISTIMKSTGLSKQEIERLYETI